MALAIMFFGFSAQTQAVVPAPDGGYPGGNTAEGQNALLGLSTGGFNTALGYFSLGGDATNSFNTAVGAGALLANTADANTATGAAALLSNTTGIDNTADGAVALLSNTTGFNNTAIGEETLEGNTTGSDNTAIGAGALLGNTSGDSNTAIGVGALQSNTGTNNIALGVLAGTNVTTGGNNILLGNNAGINVFTASNVICIGTDGNDVDDSCFIGNVFGATSVNGIGVLVNSNGRLGTTTSSARFKEQIRPMGKTSEELLALKPVTFRYKKEIDAAGTSQFGLVAEDVEKVNPDLVVRDKEGKPYSVRYDQVNAMLLNEFLKEHKKVEKLEATVADLAAELRQVKAQVQRNSPTLRVAAKNP